MIPYDPTRQKYTNDLHRSDYEKAGEILQTTGESGQPDAKPWRNRRVNKSAPWKPNKWMSIEDRFWMQILVTENCWEWIGATDRKGYGVFGIGRRRNVFAHRYSYQLRKGLIPGGLTLDHLCRNRRCVKPAHMEVVSRGENVRRGIGITATNARKTHCRHGHELIGENVRRDSNGRACRECRILNNRALRIAARLGLLGRSAWREATKGNQP